MNYATKQRTLFNELVPDGQFQAILNFNQKANEKYLSAHSLNKNRTTVTIWSKDDKPVVDIHKVNGNFYAYYFDVDGETYNKDLVHHIVSKVFHKGKHVVKDMSEFRH